MPIERLDLIFDALPGAYLLLLPNPPLYTIVGCNHGYPAATKRHPQDLLRKNLFEAFPDNPADSFASGVRNLSASLGHVVKFREKHVMAIQKYDIPVDHGNRFEERYWQPENIPIVDESGNLIYIVHSVVDVTKEVALYNSENDLRTMLHRSTIIIVWDEAKRIREVSPSACQLLGYTKDELVGQLLDELKPDPEHVNLHGSEEENFVWKLQRKDGGLVYVQLSTYRTNYGDDVVNLAVGTDVTETIFLRRRIVEERDRAHADMIDAVLGAQEQQRKQIGLELHDNIIQILTTARLFLDRQLSEGRDAVNAARTAHELLSKAIHELRLLSESVSPSALGDQSLRGTIENLIADVSILKPIAFNTSFEFHEEHLTPKLRLDIFRIIQEQMSNILKYSNATLVSIAIQERTDFVYVTINDNGVGFDSGSQPMGLGFKNMLSRCHVHRGRLDVHSRPGSGCHVMAILGTTR